MDTSTTREHLLTNAPFTLVKSELHLLKQGAEARIYTGTFHGRPCIVKERFSKKYRHPDLDKDITSQRLKSEARSLTRCHTAGVHAPTVYNINLNNSEITMEHIVNSMTVKDFIKQCCSPEILEKLALEIGANIGKLHSAGIIHGDLTTSNMLVRDEDVTKLSMIDFGLSFLNPSAEDKGVDLYVLERALLSTHPESEEIFDLILKSYSKATAKDAKETLRKLEEIRLRGRKRSMVG